MCRWRASWLVPSYTWMTARKRSFTPRPLLNEVGMNGMPKSVLSVGRSMLSPRCSNSSYMFSAPTIGTFMSTSWVVR